MLLADVLRAVLLALARRARRGPARCALWQMMVIVAIYGGAQAFFDPASDAILPEILPASQLGEANALEQLARPLTLRLAGPALGGLLVGVARNGRGLPRRRRHLPDLRARRCGRCPRARLRARRRGVRGRHLDAGASCARAGPTCAATCGCGGPSRARASPTCCSWAPPRCCCPTWSSTNCGGSGARARAGAGRRRPRLGRVRAVDDPLRAAAQQHHLHLSRSGRSPRLPSRATAWPPQSGS